MGGVHFHTFEDRKSEALQQRDWWSRTRSDSDRGRFRSMRRTTAPPRSTHVQPGDVSRSLIQQGGGISWGRPLQSAARRRGGGGAARFSGKASPGTTEDEEVETYMGWRPALPRVGSPLLLLLYIEDPLGLFEDTRLSLPRRSPALPPPRSP